MWLRCLTPRGRGRYGISPGVSCVASRILRTLAYASSLARVRYSALKGEACRWLRQPKQELLGKTNRNYPYSVI